MPKMSLKEQREIAIRATRSEFRRCVNWLKNPEDVSADKAIKVLDDLARKEPYLIASIWYKNASDAQIKLFKREWTHWAIQQHKDREIDSCLRQMGQRGQVYIYELPAPYRCDTCYRVGWNTGKCNMPQPPVPDLPAICPGKFVSTE